MSHCIACHYLHRRKKEGTKSNVLFFQKGQVDISLCTLCDLAFFQSGQYQLLDKLMSLLDNEASHSADAMVLRNKILRVAPQSLRAKVGRVLPVEERPSDFERILEMDAKLGL